jgi:exonuclease III
MIRKYYKRVLTFLFAACFAGSIFSQELVRIMGYNLLYYGSYTSFCTQDNNSHITKAGYLATILDYVKPDIFVVTELATSPYYANYLLGGALNVNGVTHFDLAPVTNESGSNITNGLFYNKDKFELFSQTVVQTDLRDINIYKLRYKNYEEPLYINIAAAHLKAGNNATDRNERLNMVSAAMDYIYSLGNNDNFIFMGDLNVYYSDEPSYQLLINPSNPYYAFYDPIDRPGYWSINSNFADVHTQSTRTDNSNSCFVTGGLDDRFDFILADEAIMEGSQKILYKNDSYTSLGQDGLRFDGSLISPGNNSLPANIISALYNMSDHLPVYADFYFGDISSVASVSGDQKFSARLTNPINTEFAYELKTSGKQEVKLELFFVTGQHILTDYFVTDRHYKGSIPANTLPDGLYIISFTGRDFKKSYRIVKSSQ